MGHHNTHSKKHNEREAEGPDTDSHETSQDVSSHREEKDRMEEDHTAADTGQTGKEEENNASRQEEAPEHADGQLQEANERVEELQEQVEEQKNKYVRLMAEFENFKRRKDEERKRLIRSANEELLTEFITVKEHFDRALDTARTAENVEAVIDGMQMIYDSFIDIFTRNGVEEFAEKGEEFDPQFHDALMKQPDAEIEEGKISTIYEKGYMLHDKVLKHAKVVVSAGPPSQEQEDA